MDSSLAGRAHRTARGGEDCGSGRTGAACKRGCWGAPVEQCLRWPPTEDAIPCTSCRHSPSSPPSSFRSGTRDSCTRPPPPLSTSCGSCRRTFGAGGCGSSLASLLVPHELYRRARDPHTHHHHHYHHYGQRAMSGTATLTGDGDWRWMTAKMLMMTFHSCFYHSCCCLHWCHCHSASVVGSMSFCCWCCWTCLLAACR